jgi:hypothetical protein
MYSMYPFQSPYLSQPTQNIQYVNGRQSAESYQMPANSSVILMDSGKARFYMKQTDASGMATVRAYDFKEAVEEKPTEYVTKSEFESFKAEVKGVKDESDSVTE